MSDHILIVDDSSDSRDLMILMLSKALPDAALLTAANGQDALRLAANQRIDLILMDAVMPVMSGFEACQHLKQIDETRHIPILMISGVMTNSI